MSPELLSILNAQAERSKGLNLILDKLEYKWWVKSLDGGTYPEKAGDTRN